MGAPHVALVAVTKTFGVDAWLAATAAGCDGIGENYAQELLDKRGSCPSNVAPLHFIGAVQSNKVKKLLPHVELWHGIDRESVIDELSRQAQRLGGATPRILIQVNSTGESTKSGCDPSEVGALVDRSRGAGLEVRGLMTIGPTSPDRQLRRESFRLTRALADDLGLPDCSMGMSGDYEDAVECGSTIIRLGSSLFGARS